MPYPITPTPQHYAWGGYEFLPQLLGKPAGSEPTAELWMGDHPKGPALLTGKDSTLADLIAQDPVKYLSQAVIDRFGERLPFLFKVLDVQQMLSIQVHPDKGTAEAGFAREEAKGPERSAPNRNYRDDNHKPELGVAITDFYLLHGFKSPIHIQRTLDMVPGWTPLKEVMRAEGVEGLYEYVMRADQETIDTLLQTLVDDLSEATYHRSQAEFWAKRAVEQYSRDGHHDRGMFSIFWFNLVHLRPGQAIFQDAGIPHAYLEGKCLELMAGSDNVLRGGLTPKHIDVNELLLNIRFATVIPTVLEAQQTRYDLTEYVTPVPDFRLRVVRTSIFGDSYIIEADRGPAIVFLLEGKVEIKETGITLGREQRAVFLAAGESIRLFTMGQSVVYIAEVGE